MNRELSNGQTVLLCAQRDELHTRTVRILELLGDGASCVAYLAEEPDTGLRFVLKECCPISDAGRTADGYMNWSSEGNRIKAETSFVRAVRVQQELQKSALTDSVTHLIDGIYKANNTLYTLTDLHNTRTYEGESDSNLQEIFITARTLAKTVKCYHSMGYLLLDIKPQNIMIYPETREMILFLDFDGIVPKSEISLESVSYSQDYAAPEQTMGNLHHIGEATDIYAIGAIVYQRIFNRLPDVEDRSTFAEWDFNSSPLFEKVSPKTVRLASELFHNTLAANPERRYPSCDELVRILDELVRVTDPKARYLKSTLPESYNVFVGREKELAEIARLYKEGKKLVYLTGMGGIGKTELALRYAALSKAQYDTICFGRYRTTLENVFQGDSCIHIVSHDGSELASLKAFRDLCDERTLLIIDSYDTDEDFPEEDEDTLENLRKLPCRILITTRNSRVDDEVSGHVTVANLEEDDQLQLFADTAGIEVTKENMGAIHSILQYISGYTLLITLIAKQYRNGCCPLEELAGEIREAGLKASSNIKVKHRKDKTINGTVYGILLRVLDQAKLSEDELYVLRSLAILGRYNVRKAVFLGWIGEEYEDAINTLTDNNWAERKNTGADTMIGLHDVVRMIVREESSATVGELPWVEELILKTAKENKANGRSVWKDDTIADYQLVRTSNDYIPKDECTLVESLIMELDLSDYQTAVAILNYYFQLCFSIKGIIDKVNTDIAFSVLKTLITLWKRQLPFWASFNLHYCSIRTALVKTLQNNTFIRHKCRKREGPSGEKSLEISGFFAILSMSL